MLLCFQTKYKHNKAKIYLIKLSKMDQDLQKKRKKIFFCVWISHLIIQEMKKDEREFTPGSFDTKRDSIKK